MSRIATRERMVVGLGLVVLTLFALPWFSPQPAAARGAGGRTVSPLPASDYSVRRVCRTPARGHAACLALELVPETPAARAHKHPIGRARIVPASAGQATEVCEPPTAAEDCYGLRPQDLHSAYALPTTAPSAQTVALVDAYDDPTAEADLKVYDEEFHLPPCTHADGCFTKVNENGQSTPLPEPDGEWAEETSLDIEVAHATCQNCQILLVEAEESTSESLETAEDTAARLGAGEISNSWGGEEEAEDSAAFNHPGVAITASAGDEGYLNWQEPATEGAVEYPASSPHVVAVGGTRLSLTSAGAWEGETVWNGYGATGGGCSKYFAASSWQAALANWSAVGCGSKRAVSDVSADADPYTGVAVYDSTPVPVEGGKHHEQEVPGWFTLGGTSVSSPLIASTFALAGGGSVAYPAKTLYEREVGSPASLHDITSGSNGECSKPFDEQTGLSGCTALEEAQKSCASTAICLAGTGYDGPSGVGSPDGIGAFQAPRVPVKKSQTITFTSIAPTSATVDGPSYSVVATASSGLSVSFSSGTPSVCSASGSTMSFVGVGTCTIDANQAGNGEYEPAPQAQQSFAVGKGSQTITFTSAAPSSATVGGATYTVTATASSGLSVSFSSGTPSVCSVTGSTVSFEAAGTCTVEANQAGNANFSAAPQMRQSFGVAEKWVAKKSQTITFTSGAPTSATVGGPTYLVVATASSELPVSYSSATPSVCSVTGSTVSFEAAGKCTIDANQAGTAEVEPAPRAQQSFAVAEAPTVSSGSGLGLISTLPSELVSSGGPSTVVISAPDSTFGVAGAKVNQKTGAITFSLTVDNPGTLSWALTFPNGRFGAFAARVGRCGKGLIKVRGRCRLAPIVFAKGGLAVAGAGEVTFTVKPSPSAVKALRNARRRKHALPVTATLTYQSSLGGPPAAQTRWLGIKARKRS